MKSIRFIWRHLISCFFTIICILIILVLSYYRNRERNFEVIDNYINELARNTATHVSDVFKNKLDAINTISYLYSDAAESDKVDYSLLGGLENRSGFDWIRFVDLQGMNYTSTGTTKDVSDREYYLEGLQGSTGICYIPVSRINGEKLIGVYAPIYYQDRINGVMVGFLTESTVSSILTTNLYDYPANTYIVSRQGTTLGRYMGEGTYQATNIDMVLSYVKEQHRDELIQAIEDQHTCQFRFQGTEEESVGYVIPIENTDWSLVQIFPSEATHMLIQATQKDSYNLFFWITFVFVIFIFIGLVLFRENIRERNEEFTYEKINAILRSITDDYIYLIDIDLITEREIRYRLSNQNKLEDWAGDNNDYTQCVEAFAREIVADYDREYFLGATKLSNLIRILSSQADYYIEYDGVIEGKTLRLQGKFTMPKDKQFENHMLVSVRDITEISKERREKERELSEARRMAETSDRAKTAFLFNMSHDIRTPMNAIVGYTNLLEKNLDNREKVGDYIDKIKSSSEFLLALINNVLEMARIESGKVTIEESLWNVEESVNTLVSVFEGQFRQKGLHFTREIQVKHKNVYCDSLKLKQIYLNILSNAVKYTPAGGTISLTLKELPGKREGYGEFQCVIKDSGIGMSREFQKHLFEEFTRETTVTESKIAGSGLGMAIVKRLVEMMKGTVQVESAIGEGTTFIVTIPHRLAEEKSLQQKNGRMADYENRQFVGKRILMAEDNELNAEIAIELLKNVGFEVEVAWNGQICVEMLTNAQDDYYDLILMDVQMPGMNGYEATSAIRRMPGRKGKIPIFAITANAFEVDKKNALDSGMNGHIAKPIEISKLLETINEIWQPK